jgi:hypothetical protein
VAREARLLGFVLLLAAIFAVAQMTGAHLGPVSTGHAQVGNPGAPAGTGGMNMGGGR